jgi:hypothetical protein
LIDPALPEITTASPLLHHSLGHDPLKRVWMTLKRVWMTLKRVHRNIL